MANETVSYDTEDHGRDAMNLAGYVVWDGRRQGVHPISYVRWNRANRLAGKVNAVLKKALDLFGAATGLVLLFPLLLGISVAIKTTSRGPVLFRQTRYGRHGRRFTVLKFRTMHLEQCDPSGVAQTVADDPRVTLVGRFLRKSNFDELPQLINVLKGEMSLVGPRPHVPGMLAAGVPYERFDPRYMDRHQALPGLTGLAQVNGYRGETKEAHAARMRLECDLTYVRHQSVWLDLKIIAATLYTEFFKGKGY